MNPFERVASLSPLPIVDLTTEALPLDGIFVKLSDECRKHYGGSDQCKQHYQKLLDQLKSRGEPIQCPFGFASVPFRTAEVAAALTGFVPFPRLGGPKERAASKRNRKHKISIEAVDAAVISVINAAKEFVALEDEVVKGQSMGLHEIRKLNKTIKQTSERLCRKNSPQDPDRADPEFVRIWKSSELMSYEFDVIELLANANLAKLPMNTTIEPYRIFDKCVRIYSSIQGGRKLTIHAPYSYHPRITACDKTFHIIPSVFIENALKYSAPGSEIRIEFNPDLAARLCVVTVTSESEGNQLLDERVFSRGYRASNYGDGSGNGLFVAQLVAHQHNSEITVRSSVLNPARVRHIFTLPLNALH